MGARLVKHWKSAAGGVAVLAALLGLYFGWIHPWLMGWGATAEERAMALPGDESAGATVTWTTRAITIAATPAEVWPWLLQMGQDRGGFYSNDWLENLIGLNMHNASAIRPEWQHRELGDVVLLVPNGYLGGVASRAVAHDEGAPVGPKIWLLTAPEVIADSPARFVLLPSGAGTRLLLRESVESNTPGGGAIGELVGRLLWDPAHFVMEQRMLRGIKERAEGQPLVSPLARTISECGWMLASAFLFTLPFLRRQGYLRLVLPVAAMIPALVYARDLDAAMAAFLALGLTSFAPLLFGPRWVRRYAVSAAGVLFVLLFAPDAHAVFGIAFAVLGVVAVGLAVRAALEWNRGAPRLRTKRG